MLLLVDNGERNRQSFLPGKYEAEEPELLICVIPY